VVTLAATNKQYKSWVASEDDTIILLEKAQSGRTTLDDIADALDEYKRLFIAGLASPGETITLSRAYPDNEEYAEACLAINDDEDEEKVMIVGGPASVEAVDREGHLITSDALKKAFKKYMDNFRGRNVMVMHSDVQVGHALPAFISRAGNVFKSGVDDKGLFFISELRDDTKIANRVRDQIKKGGMSSYSIAGSATQSKEINKSDGSHVLQVDDMELAEVTICEKGVNQNAHFELLKGDKAEGSCADGSCLTKSHDSTPEPEIIAISKSEIPSFKNMLMNWVSKESKDEDTPRAVAIATAQAKKEGYKKFTDGSPGDDRRDKIAEEIKESLKKAFLRKEDPSEFNWYEQYQTLDEDIPRKYYYDTEKKIRPYLVSDKGEPVLSSYEPFTDPDLVSRSVYNPETGRVKTVELIQDSSGKTTGASTRTGFQTPPADEARKTGSHPTYIGSGSWGYYPQEGKGVSYTPTGETDKHGNPEMAASEKKTGMLSSDERKDPYDRDVSYTSEMYALPDSRSAGRKQQRYSTKSIIKDTVQAFLRKQDPEKKEWFNRYIFEKPAAEGTLVSDYDNPLATYDDPNAPSYPVFPSWERPKWLGEKVAGKLGMGGPTEEERKRETKISRDVKSAEVPIDTGGYGPGTYTRSTPAKFIGESHIRRKFGDIKEKIKDIPETVGHGAGRMVGAIEGIGGEVVEGFKEGRKRELTKSITKQLFLDKLKELV